MLSNALQSFSTVRLYRETLIFDIYTEVKRNQWMVEKYFIKKYICVYIYIMKTKMVSKKCRIHEFLQMRS